MAGDPDPFDPHDPRNINPGPPPNPPDPANPDNQEVTVKSNKTLLTVVVLGFLAILAVQLYSLNSKPSSAGGTVDLKPIVQTQQEITNALDTINKNQLLLANGLDQLPGKIPTPTLNCEALKECLKPTPSGHTHNHRTPPPQPIVIQGSNPPPSLQVTVTTECFGNCGGNPGHPNPPPPPPPPQTGPENSRGESNFYSPTINYREDE
jgi:hypothetical protein